MTLFHSFVTGKSLHDHGIVLVGEVNSGLTKTSDYL